MTGSAAGEPAVANDDGWIREAQAAGRTGTFRLDLTTERLEWTAPFAALVGFGPDDRVDVLADWERFIFADDVPKLRAAIAEVRAGGPFSVEMRARTGGATHWLTGRGQSRRDEQGKPRWLVGSLVEITDSKAEEARLSASNEALKVRIAERGTQLRESENRFRLLVEAATDYAMFLLDPAGNVASWNPGAERIKGYAADEIVGKHFSHFYTEEDRVAGVPARLLAGARATGRSEIEGWRVRKDGKKFWASVVIAAINGEDDELVGFAKITRDLTERRNAEERIRRAQKMEAIGQLTGGVAHDFNNILTVISGNLETVLRHLPQGAAKLERSANAALRGATRAGALTQQLLAFARRQALEPKALSLNELVTTLSQILRRTLGENILVETRPGNDLWTAFADGNQLENAILNLAINARDAMPEGGRLTIETANVYLDRIAAARLDGPAGQYVSLAVRDTGTGMSPETMSKAFEPFFTTKELGQGTGLGLSQVYGFVRQSGGYVGIDSDLGLGTTVKIYLPRHHSDQNTEDDRGMDGPVPRAREETILVAEDDLDVRNFTVEMLIELGYRVIATPDGHAALHELDAHDEIDLLFTDVGLPGGMNGRQLAEAARLRRPGLKVLFTSGYARHAIVHHGRLDPGVELLPKPFTFANLAAKLRHVLDLR
ncbi:MAG TPA: PAS domain S-box protein [Stellaceae bacterium]|nr:PAS domain S-box protein [Stellaceae bacterium]